MGIITRMLFGLSVVIAPIVVWTTSAQLPARVASHFGMRMPELHCGFARRPGEPPIAYPVACLPQAWSAGAVFMGLQACLGLSIDALAHEVRIDHPTLPRELEHLAVRGLAIGDSSVDLVFQRTAGGIVASAERVPDDVRILMTT